MRKAFYLTALVLFTFGMDSCKDDDAVTAETTDLEISFRATYDDATLVTGQTYDYAGTPIQFTKFDFYVADLVLLKNDASGTGEVALKDIDFVELTFGSSQQAEAEAGYAITSREMEVGNYTGVKLGVGVPPDLNKTEWTDYGPGHPLRNQGFFWDAWSSFIFAKIEGKMDLDGDNVFEHSFLFHSGRDTAYFDHSIVKGIELKKGVVGSLGIEVDVQKLFQNAISSCDADNDGLLDLQTEGCNRSHGSPNNQQDPVIQMMQNFGNALSVKN